MHAVKQVASHQAVAAPAENIQPRTPGHEQPHPVAVGVEEALEQRLPFRVLVQFVEDGHGRLRTQPVQVQRFGQRCGTAQEQSPVIGVVPVEIGVGERAAHGGLADLARSGDQGHLTMPLQVILQHGGVEAGTFSHATIIAHIVKWSRPFYDGRDNGREHADASPGWNRLILCPKLPPP